MHTSLNIKTRQHGAVLVISLLILLVLTLIGVSSMDGSIMEEKMASNSQIAATTFQRAESSIREAFFDELTNPSGAVGKDRDGAAAVNHDDTVNGITISSTSRHMYDPNADAITMKNSSDSVFEARAFEIIGTAEIGAIRSVHTQGYLVLNQIRRP